MLPWIRRGAAWAASRVPTLLSLCLLAGVAFWGYRNDWALPSLASLWGAAGPAPKDPAEEGPRVVPDPSGGASRVEFPTAEAVRKAGLRTERAQARPLAPYVTANGAVDYDPSGYARLTSRASGSVWSVRKEIGDPVVRGEVLALLDAAEVGKAKADFLQSLAQVKVRSAALERLQSAGREGAVPERSLREAQAALREARIRVFNDQQALLNLGLPVRLKDVEDLPEEQLVRRLRLLGLPDEVTRGLDPETLTANLLPLTAPFDGVVVLRDAAPGEVIQGTTPKTLFVVADIHHLHIDLDVNPEDMRNVRKGQAVTFWTDGGATEVAGEVAHISPEVDEKTRRVVVHAEVPNPDGRLRPNAFGTGRILLGEPHRAVMVPQEAVQADGSTHLVFVARSETAFEARPVEPGQRDGDLVEVKGVEEGEVVVTTGSFDLKSELQRDRITGGDD